MTRDTHSPPQLNLRAWTRVRYGSGKVPDSSNTHGEGKQVLNNQVLLLTSAQCFFLIHICCHDVTNEIQKPPHTLHFGAQVFQGFYPVLSAP